MANPSFPAKINILKRRYGTYKAVADRLDISVSYLYRLRRGKRKGVKGKGANAKYLTDRIFGGLMRWRYLVVMIISHENYVEQYWGATSTVIGKHQIEPLIKKLEQSGFIIFEYQSYVIEKFDMSDFDYWYKLMDDYNGDSFMNKPQFIESLYKIAETGDFYKCGWS